MAGPIGLGVGAALGVKRVVCPKCGTAIARGKHAAGTITCKRCGHRFDVPRAAPATDRKRRR